MREALRLPDGFAPWLTHLESLGEPRRVIPMAPDEARALLQRMGVRAADIETVVSTIPAPDGDPALWWLLERCHAQLAGDMGGIGLLPWPPLPASLGERGRLFYVHVFLATVPVVRRWHEERGIADDVSDDTLSDLGNQMDIHRWMYGRTGLETHGWLTLHFRGAIFRLQRLQFERSRIGPGPGQPPLFWYDAASVQRHGAGFRPGDHALGVHIPRGAPLAPDACDDAFERARTFFPRHFPSERCRVAICTSWLLDEQLAEYLPSESNIVRFQRRFEMVPGARDGEEDVMRFIFGRVAPALGDLPQVTRLERAIVEHMRAGRRWRTRTGWLEL